MTPFYSHSNSRHRHRFFPTNLGFAEPDGLSTECGLLWLYSEIISGFVTPTISGMGNPRFVWAVAKEPVLIVLRMFLVLSVVEIQFPVFWLVFGL
jgi:hypothetical protein